MSGGSRDAEGPDEEQCQHCGRWYSKAGVISHEEHCEWAEFDTRLQPLECVMTLWRAPDVEVVLPEVEVGDETPDVVRAEGSVEPSEGEMHG